MRRRLFFLKGEAAFYFGARNGLEVGVGGDVGQKRITHRLIVNLATIMVDAIAHNQIIHFQNHVVPGYLVENGLGDGDVWSLVLHNHTGAEVLVEQNRVATFLRAVQVKLYLVGQQSLRIALVVRQEMCEMLAHPFLGSERDIFFSQRVENEVFSVPLLYFNGKGW